MQTIDERMNDVERRLDATYNSSRAEARRCAGLLRTTADELERLAGIDHPYTKAVRNQGVVISHIVVNLHTLLRDVNQATNNLDYMLAEWTKEDELLAALADVLALVNQAYAYQDAGHDPTINR